MRKPSIILAISAALSKPPDAALWKSSICRIQLVNGFHLGQIWATIFRSRCARASDGKPSASEASRRTREGWCHPKLRSVAPAAWTSRYFSPL